MLTKQHNTFPSPSIQNKSYDSICAVMSFWFVLNHMMQNSFYVVMDKILVTCFFLIGYTTKPSKIDMDI